METSSPIEHLVAYQGQEMKVYTPPPGPKAPSSYPGLIMVHGGYWSEDSGLGDWPKKLAEKGWVVFTPPYRLSSEAIWPAQRDDLLTWLNYILDQCAQWKLDTDRICALGSSAGGHLAVQLGMFRPDDIQAVAAVSPVCSPYRAWQDGFDPLGSWAEKKAKLREAAEDLAGCSPEAKKSPCWQQWVDLVCYQHVTGDEPPMMLVHYTDDLVPSIHSADLQEKILESDGEHNDVTVMEVHGKGHGLSLLKVPGVLDAMESFLARSFLN